MQGSNLLWNVAFIAPTLIVYLLATILGLVNLSKHKPAALYTALGGMIAGVVSVSAVFARELLWANMKTTGDIESAAELSRLIGIGANVVEAVGMAMIVFAVFTGRKPVQRDDDLPTARASRRRS